MRLTEEVKNKIVEILNDDWFKNKLYEGLTDEERDELGMVYTPPEICIQMIEKFKCETLSSRNILDPTCGSGNLLIACLIAGADSDKVFGNDYSLTAVKLCRERLHEACKRLNIININDWQIHRGNALHEFALTEFMPDYDDFYFGRSENIDDLNKIPMPGCSGLEINYHDYWCFEKIKDKYPEDYKQYDLNCSNKIKKYNQEQANKPFVGGLWG